MEDIRDVRSSGNNNSLSASVNARVQKTCGNRPQHLGSGTTKLDI